MSMSDTSVPYRSSPLTEAVEGRDSQILDMVRTAIETQNFLLAYQPVVAAGEPHRRPTYYEGLARVLDETGRIIPAADFIPAVEATSLGRAIDCLSLQHGLRMLADVPGLRLSINMSARSIRNERWMDILYAGLSVSPTIGERLILEITEGSAIELPDVTCQFMDELQSYSIAFALDDFGSGYTSLRYLRDFCFDIVKIDGGFIQGIAADYDKQAIVKAMVSLSQHFEMYSVAEFVETHDDAVCIDDLGIDAMQGNFFGAATINPTWIPNTVRKAG